MEKENDFDSYKGKLWSTAVQKAFEAPFPEVAIQHLLMRVYQKARIEAFEELLSMKWVAVNEREAILKTPAGILRAEDSLSEPVNVEERRLLYVKVLDIQKLLRETKDRFPQEAAPKEKETPPNEEQ